MTRNICSIATLCLPTLLWSATAGAASLGVQNAEPAPSASTSLAPPSDPNALRICASKNQPPLSMADETGLENKIAVVVAETMKRKPQFVWTDRPAIYVVRDLLDKKLCDVVIGLDTGDPRVASSKPYYRAGYVFVTRADRGLDIKSWNDARLKSLGHLAVAFGSPGEVLMKDMGLYENNMNYLYSLVNFRSARNQYTQIDPSRMVQEVATGSADIAVAFAPDVARYVKSSTTALRVESIADDAAKSNGEKVPQQFDQSVGVRRDDTALLAQIDAALTTAKPKIDAILEAEGVPLLSLAH
ncbi:MULTISPECIES: methanol oxidation system protein MoxJ [Methylosinus]|uniref:Methanol oxidation system protein MoxJ n=1 Tax=Methylosinus trichosporium (strain ATCC 35070 / NCIMB 11131 / UNIQEM 75 / OB3b) TaxID=595536 RepID=A0A2D2D1Q3_METT3|nr:MULTISPECIES: methanol oxidation system protein MoxJ [Methylosinus]ATQ68945.1 methanol oxidation system protein MoxJ [Methylosinus trichosporium OB3b]OBS52264.1 methanol oxidation system protein MoxJ [Methylosinus sp. 3S-1]